MQILLLAPYCGGSHRAWAQGYAAHSRHEVTLLDLPARFWKWRMQGGAVTLVERARALGFRPDLILATDMVNLPAFLGLARDFLADISVGGDDATIVRWGLEITSIPEPSSWALLGLGFLGGAALRRCRRSKH